MRRHVYQYTSMSTSRHQCIQNCRYLPENTNIYVVSIDATVDAVDIYRISPMYTQ